ncbi:MAG TPA: glycosyltransferase [Alphaproteobacteria bacterium]
MLTVVLATLGQRHVARMLEALNAVDAPCPWKLIIAHNGADQAQSAEFRSLIERFAGHLPIQYVYEPRRGKNYGCNAAIPHIEGDLAVFTDDDVVPARDWLVRLYEAAEANPDYDIFGGRIVPLWPRPPERWLLESVPIAVVFVASPDEWVEGPAEPWKMWGANVAFRTRIFAAGHCFDTSIGPDGTATYAMGSETEFVERLARAGYRCWYTPSAVVQHIIREEQFDRDWILQRAFRYGRFEGRRAAYASPDGFGPHRTLASCAVLIPAHLCRAAYYWLRRDPRRLRAEFKINLLYGKAREAARLMRITNHIRTAKSRKVGELERRV